MFLEPWDSELVPGVTFPPEDSLAVCVPLEQKYKGQMGATRGKELTPSLGGCSIFSATSW